MPASPHKVARIRQILASGQAWLAPLAGVGDPVFRGLCREQGAGLTFTEMVSAKGLLSGNAKTAELIVRAPGEDACGVQLFGHEPDVIAGQARAIADAWGEHLALIDINMGCPVPKVTRKGEGSALLKDPTLACAIVRSVDEAVPCPVTCKIRSGWDSAHVNAPEVAALLEEAGAACVTVHGRTTAQLYHGSADWEVIARVKKAVSIPVIGNGDVMTHAQIAAMKQETGCDGVMVARGARGNPWIFSGHEPTADERIDCAIRHLEGLCALDPVSGVARMRKHVPWYLTGLPYASSVRAAANSCMTEEDLEGVLYAVRFELGDKGFA